MNTWHYEGLAVGAILAFVCLVTHGGLVEWIGASAVLLSFGHGQVADRLAEREAVRTVVEVDCHRWATRYFLGKESLWLVYFLMHRSWSALVGVGIFLAYPAWRRVWRKRHPLA